MSSKAPAGHSRSSESRRHVVKPNDTTEQPADAPRRHRRAAVGQRGAASTSSRLTASSSTRPTPTRSATSTSAATSLVIVGQRPAAGFYDNFAANLSAFEAYRDRRRLPLGQRGLDRVQRRRLRRRRAAGRRHRPRRVRFVERDHRSGAPDRRRHAETVHRQLREPRDVWRPRRRHRRDRDADRERRPDADRVRPGGRPRAGASSSRTTSASATARTPARSSATASRTPTRRRPPSTRRGCP